MEPNSTQCFGGAGCTPPTYGYDLWLWNQGGGTFYLWDDYLPPPIILEYQCPPYVCLYPQYASGYTHDPINRWYSFRTNGLWE
jgi:hypothetical protein